MNKKLKEALEAQRFAQRVLLKDNFVLWKAKTLPMLECLVACYKIEIDLETDTDRLDYLFERYELFEKLLEIHKSDDIECQSLMKDFDMGGEV